jgi:D-arabinose 1-dehydrogenase-like Zn-dependent alcohol dehydrogenase
MTVADTEREYLGTALEPGDRVVAGLVVGFGALGHTALAAAAATFLYTVFLAL